MARDRLGEIEAIRERQGRQSSRHSAAMSSFGIEWSSGDGPLARVPEFVPVRLVTILEAFARSWISKMVDAGEPYITRAASLVKSELKIDFAIARALAGRRVTLGELIAHTISVNRIGDIERVFSALVDRDLFVFLGGVVSRWDVEILEKPPAPIIDDVASVRANLARLFEVRHVLVHELPADRAFATGDLDRFVHAVDMLIRAGDEAFSGLLYGNYPLTQTDMNIAASADAREADHELEILLDTIDPTRTNGELRALQAAWEKFREMQASYRSGIHSPQRGTVAPLVYANEYTSITRERIKYLQSYLDRAEGEL